jgi:probable HAF family extracellular repeat protein
MTVKVLKGLTLSFGLAALVCLPLASMAQINYTFETVNYPTAKFTQLLGINKNGIIAGYRGSGLPGHPNKGFTLVPPNTFTAENFPGSVQTQVIGINNNNVFGTAGFYIDRSGANHGFLKVGGSFKTVDFPATTSVPKFNQLLGLNAHGQSAGFYNDAAGNSHGYIYASQGGVFLVFTIPGATSATATGANEAGQTSGFYTDKAGVMHGFLLNQGQFTILNFPGATATQAFGLNNRGQVVGSYTDSAGLVHGFVWTKGTFQGPVDDPNAPGATIINGINDGATIVGFYGMCVSAPVGATTCNGFVGTP